MAEKVEYDLTVNTESAKLNMDSFALKIGAASAVFGELVDIAKNAFRSVNQFVQDSINDWADYELQVTNLNSVLKATGGSAGYTTGELQDMASRLQETTMFGDDLTISAMAMLATFRNIGHDVFPQTIEAAQDMATVFGMDLKSATMMIGKALNDPIESMGALRRAGVQFTDEQEKMIKTLVESNDLLGAQKMILGEVEQQMGGAAKAAGETLRGQITQLTNAFGDMKKGIGELVSGSLGPLIDGIKEVINLATKLISHEAALSQVQKKQNELSTMSIEVLRRYAEALRGEIQYLKSSIKNDASGMLSASLGKDAENYGKLLEKVMAEIAVKEKEAERIAKERLATQNSLVGSATKQKEIIASIITDVENIQAGNFETIRKRLLGLPLEYKEVMDLMMAGGYANFPGPEPAGIEKGFLEPYLTAGSTGKEAAKDIYELSDAMKTMNDEMIRATATGFVDSMKELGASAYDAGLSIDDVGAALGQLGLQILNSLPNMFLQAGLMAIIGGNWPLGLALIAMAGVSGFAAGAANAAAGEETSDTTSTTENNTVVNIENNSGVKAETRETVLPDGTKVVDVVIGKVAQEMARGSFDGVMKSRYGMSYAGVRR